MCRWNGNNVVVDANNDPGTTSWIVDPGYQANTFMLRLWNNDNSFLCIQSDTAVVRTIAQAGLDACTWKY